VAQAAVRADLLQALDRLRALAAQVALATSSSVRSRTFVSGESPSAAQIFCAVGCPIPKM
jgi:hypothetical protein